MSEAKDRSPARIIARLSERTRMTAQQFDVKNGLYIAGEWLGPDGRETPARALKTNIIT